MNSGHNNMKTKFLYPLLVLLWVLLSAQGCATWEDKLDQRANWEKFREESNPQPTLPFQKWPREK